MDPEKYYITFRVKKDDKGIRPAGKPDECFYCHSKVGTNHERGCVITWNYRKEVLTAVVKFRVEVPEHWSREDIMRRYNESSWCVSNIFKEDDCGCDRYQVYFPDDVVALDTRR